MTSPAEVDALNREASERFAAGYIQCMHDVHTFVSGCPGMDPAVAAELLNQLLESMPLNDELRREMLQEAGATSDPDKPACAAGVVVSPAPSSTPDDLSSDLDETDSEPSPGSSSEEAESQDGSLTLFKVMWRPW